MCTSLIESLQINNSTFLSSGRSTAIMLENTYNHRNTYDYTLPQYTWNILIRFINPIIKGTHSYLKSRVVGNRLATPHCELLPSSILFSEVPSTLHQHHHGWKQNVPKECRNSSFLHRLKPTTNWTRSTITKILRIPISDWPCTDQQKTRRDLYLDYSLRMSTLNWRLHIKSPKLGNSVTCAWRMAGRR